MAKILAYWSQQQNSTSVEAGFHFILFNTTIKDLVINTFNLLNFVWVLCILNTEQH